MSAKAAPRNPKVDGYITKEKKWRAEFEKMRAIIFGQGKTTEEFKWGHPCYTYQESNILIIQGFKEYCALMFCKGSLLKDPHGLLKAPGRSQAARQLRFISVEEIAEQESIVKAYIDEALAAQKAGLKVEFKKNPEPIPEELQKKLKEDLAFKKAFEALTPGRQRGYILHITDAKQSKTREARIEKCTPLIFDGKGLND